MVLRSHGSDQKTNFRSAGVCIKRTRRGKMPLEMTFFWLLEISKQNTGVIIALTENRLFSRQLSDGFLSAFSHQPKKKPIHTRVNILDLKILQVFFKNRGEILVFEKCWISWVFWFYFMFQDISSKKKFQNFSDW